MAEPSFDPLEQAQGLRPRPKPGTHPSGRVWRGRVPPTFDHELMKDSPCALLLAPHPHPLLFPRRSAGAPPALPYTPVSPLPPTPPGLPIPFPAISPVPLPFICRDESRCWAPVPGNGPGVPLGRRGALPEAGRPLPAKAMARADAGAVGDGCGPRVRGESTRGGGRKPRRRAGGAPRGAGSLRSRRRGRGPPPLCMLLGHRPRPMGARLRFRGAAHRPPSHHLSFGAERAGGVAGKWSGHGQRGVSSRCRAFDPMPRRPPCPPVLIRSSPAWHPSVPRARSPRRARPGTGSTSCTSTLCPTLTRS